MSSTGSKATNLLCALLAGACLATPGRAASAPDATKTTPALADTRKTHTVSKKAAPKTQTTHSTTKGTTRATGTVTARKRATHHASAATSTQKPAGRASKAATASKTSADRKTGSRGKSHRPLTARQRLARLHLEPGRVQEIQQALAREGYLHEDPNGRWDEQTRAAMLRYQTERGFSPTGLPDAKSLMKLGLGPHPLPAELDPTLARASSPSAGKTDPVAPPAAPPASQEETPSEQK